MFGLPSLPTLVAVVVLPVLIGFAIVNYKQTWYSVATFITICLNTWFISSSYMTFWYDAWRGDEPRKQTSQPVDDRPTRPDYNNIPQIQSGGEPLYNQQMDRLKIDCVGKFNRTLIDQQTGKLEVNLTEDFWLKLHGAGQSRWVTTGGVGRNDFVDMLERGVLWGAYKKVGGQGKRVPDKWRKIAQLADGYPLPSWEQLGVKTRNL
jgi:hypothetical protein